MLLGQTQKFSCSVVTQFCPPENIAIHLYTNMFMVNQVIQISFIDLTFLSDTCTSINQDTKMSDCEKNVYLIQN